MACFLIGYIGLVLAWHAYKMAEADNQQRADAGAV
jgi:hypothetical protein